MDVVYEGVVSRRGKKFSWAYWALSLLLGAGFLGGCGGDDDDDLTCCAPAPDPTVADEVMVSTFAGSGKTGFINDQGVAASFGQPWGITIDKEGNLYVADADNRSIRKITPTGEVSTFVQWVVEYTNAIHWPMGITIDANNNLYVTDFMVDMEQTGAAMEPLGSFYIHKISPDGTVNTLVGGWQGFADGQGSDARFYHPVGIAIDKAGNLYVADARNHRIRKITSSGHVSTFAGSGEPGFIDGQGGAARFNEPWGITIDKAGNFFVADGGNYRIRKISSTAEVSTLAGSGLGNFADGTGSDAHFKGVDGIAIDKEGNLYVADMYNHRIRKISPEGRVSSLAGSTKGHEDGPGNAAKFDHPAGITIDAVGNLFVTERYGHRIRKIEFKK